METYPKRILLLGSGELGKEFVISAKRLGMIVIAVDKYKNAPAMQMADKSEVINMMDGDQLADLIRKHSPHFVVPEIEAIRTTKLLEFERSGITVVPSAEATHLTMNRDAIREVAANELGLRTAKFEFASSERELAQGAQKIGFPVVIKPCMSSSGKGQSIAKSLKDIPDCWREAAQGSRAASGKVIVEEFIKFESEITVLTVKQKKGPTLFVDPIGHTQERGDYQESWIPAKLSPEKWKTAKRMAKKITDRLGGAGLFGVEFFVTRKEVIFSELSPRPHDTGMVTLKSQDLSEFDLHLRAICGLPIPHIRYHGPTASAVILADQESSRFSYQGLEKALAARNVDVRIFGKPNTRKYRRMGVALAGATSVAAARKAAKKAASLIKMTYR